MSAAPTAPSGVCFQPTHETARALSARVPWRRIAAAFALAYAGGVVLGLLVQAAGWWEGRGWETAVLVAVNRTVSPLLDPFMLYLPLLGTNYTLAPLIFLVAIWLWRRGYVTVALHLAVVQAGSWALNPLLKFTLQRGRPTLFEARGQHAFPAFPSGHSIASVAVLLTVAYLLHRCDRGTWAYWLVGVYIVVNSYSRLYLGVHWPTDVIGGMVVGAIWLIATIGAFRRVHATGPARPRPLAVDATT